MRNITVFLLLLTAPWIAAPSSAQATPIAHLTLQSQPGDPVGRGGTFDITYTPQNSMFFEAEVLRTIGPSPSELFFEAGTVTLGPDNTSVVLFFDTTQLGIPFQPGFYPLAERAPFESPGRPGLFVGFQNIGCDTLTGSFTIDRVTFSDVTTIQTFGATFEQHCGGIVPALFGSFTYDASPKVPEPASLLLLASGFAALSGITWRRHRRN